MVIFCSHSFHTYVLDITKKPTSFVHLHITHHKLGPNYYPNMDNHIASNLRKASLHGLTCAYIMKSKLLSLALPSCFNSLSGNFFGPMQTICAFLLYT